MAKAFGIETDWLEDVNINTPKAKQMILGHCNHICDRIQKNIERLNAKKSGDMLRSVFWNAYNNSGGDLELASFYVLNYARFVELAVQRGYKVETTTPRMPPEIDHSQYEAIQFSRTRGDGKVLHRPAKPFIKGEIRMHARILSERLVKFFGYTLGISVGAHMLPNTDGTIPTYDEIAASYNERGLSDRQARIWKLKWKLDGKQ